MRSTRAPSLSAVTLALAFHAAAASAAEAFRPPSVPLVAHDPYFSIWSNADRATDDATRHWTGRRHSLSSLIRIDGKAYRLLGIVPDTAPALEQRSVEVLPTRTIYSFANASIGVTLTFTTPALPDDLDVLARPVTYVSWEARSLDGQPHEVAVYFDAAAEIAVNAPDQHVVASREELPGLVGLKVGSRDQPILQKKGDDLRIDWGYLYLAATAAASPRAAMAEGATARAAFAAGAPLPADDTRFPRPANDAEPTLALAFDLGKVGVEPVRRWLMLAYDDIWAIRLMGQRLRPYWRRGGMDAAALLAQAAAQEARLAERCRELDRELMADLERAGGTGFARLAALAYRQALAANKLAADAAGKPLFFAKENFSNGCIATVDVIYPMAPLFLLFGADLAKATIVPVLEYARAPRWKFPFAPHDLGTYPHADGQVYGGGELTEENQMPVEESGNMILLVAAIAHAEGNAAFAGRYWDLLTRWAEYLEKHGRDPAHQLCTDDFAGHLARNVNLSAKAIVALGAQAKLAEMLGKQDEARRWRETAEEFARWWALEAADGDHFTLAFGKPGTWSQKYNLVWDRLLGLELFPAEVARTELAYYRRIQNRYGVPLDNRKDFTKLDWILWTACLTGSREDFDALVEPVVRFLHETPDRVPMTDWYDTKTGKMVGFRARSVVGGVFIPLLADAELWRKWASRGARVTGDWAPLPEPPTYVEVVPTARREAVTWRYTLERPGDDWMRADFDAAAWRSGPAGFGTQGTPGAAVRTEWSTREIWARRSFELSGPAPDGLELLVHHDEDVEVFINGVLALQATGYTTTYEPHSILPAALAALKSGKNVLAARCRQTGGGQYIDIGLIRAESRAK